MINRLIPFLLLGVLFLTVGPLESHAQVQNELIRSRYSPAAYYNYAEEGELTILVSVWGTVRNPGLYEVPEGTRLSTLFSVSGGPSVSQRTRRQTRTINVRLVRDHDSERDIIFESTMRNDIIVAEADPVLEPGDVLTVETVVRQGFGWRDLATIVGSGASLALILERLTR